MPRPSTALAALCAAALYSCAQRGATPPAAATPQASPAPSPVAASMADYCPCPDLALRAPLDRREVVAAVLERNPGIAAARAAWRAASARVAQRGAWDDPTVSYAFAPLSIGGDMPFGQQIEVAQRLPLAGKLGLQAAVAAAEADAARADAAAVRQRLALMASQAYDDYALALASLAAVEEQRALVTQLRAIADARVASGAGSLQESLRAESDAAEIEREASALRADRDVAAQALNALLHRPLDAEVPAPPSDPAPIALDAATGERPDLSRARAETRAADAAASLAQRQYWPEVSVTGSYASMWPSVEHQYMVGLTLSVPLQRDRIAAGVAEARAQAESARLMLEHRQLEASAEVEQARRRLAAAREQLDIVRERLEPSVEQRLAAARGELESGRASATAALDAQRDLLRARLDRHRAQAELARRTAELQLALGLIPVLATTPESP